MPGPDVATLPASPPITPSVSDKLTAAGTYMANTAVVTAAPLMGQQVNPTGAGGIEVSLIGDGITTIIQALKQHHWYDQNRYAVWTCILIAIAVCILLWHDDLRKGALNAMGAMYKAASNYGPLNKLGVLGPGSDGVKDGGT